MCLILALLKIKKNKTEGKFLIVLTDIFRAAQTNKFAADTFVFNNIVILF